jgi:hypothetical protein
MALKKMIHHAAENGYHGIVITPGLEQSKRYGLAKKLRSLEYSKGNDGKYHVIAIPHSGADLMGGMYDLPELERHIGKDLTKQIAENQGEAHPHNDAYKTISGQNLDIGGEGMKGFYDKIVPSFLNQFGKKYGAQVGTMQVPVTHALQGLRRVNGYPDDAPMNLHHFPITPEMREDVTKNGVPLYAEGGSTNRINMHHKDVIKRIPELTAAANEVEAGNMTYDQYQALVNKHKPVMPFASVPDMPSDEEIHNALTSDKREKIGAHRDIENGTHVGGRLDIPAYKDHGVWVVSVHEGKNGANAGPPIGYDSHLHIINPKFGVSVKGAMNYATGKKDKNTFATVNGAYNKLSRKQAKAMANLALNHKDWIQVGMDPERHTHFYDRATQRPIKEAAESLQIGPMVFVKHPVYHTDEEMQQFPYAKGGAVKPVGYTKEKVTVSPSLDQMRYELISVKHSKKVK